MSTKSPLPLPVVSFACSAAHLVTGALGHGVRLAVVLGHVGVHEVHDIRPDGHREHGREGGGLLGHSLLGEDGHYGAGRHGWDGGWGREGLYLLLIPDKMSSEAAREPSESHGGGATEGIIGGGVIGYRGLRGHGREFTLVTEAGMKRSHNFEISLPRRSRGILRAQQIITIAATRSREEVSCSENYDGCRGYPQRLAANLHGPGKLPRTPQYIRRHHNL